jgi:hypothetical protein
MSSFNVGSVMADGQGFAAPHDMTISMVIPTGVVQNDIMLLVVNAFTFDGSTSPGFNITDAHGTWTQVGTTQDTGAGDSGFHTYSALFKRLVGSGEGNTSFTIAYTGTAPGTDQFFWMAALGVWTGFPGGVDVHTVTTNTDSIITAPSGSSGDSGEWAVYLGAISINGGGTITAPSGVTTRENHNNSGVCAIISDSNGSVGGSGTSVGGITVSDSNGGSSNWWSMWTVTLSPTSPSGPVSGTGSIRMHKMGISATGKAPVVGTGSIRMHKMGISIQARLPGVGSVRMHKMAISSSGHAPLIGTGSIRMHKMGISGTGNQGLSIVFVSTDINGVDTYHVDSGLNAPSPQILRVLIPTAPDTSYEPAFIYALPVLEGLSGTFGDGLDVIRVLGAHNTYNLTVIEPTFDIEPWYADNSTDSGKKYETFMVELAGWVESNLGTGGEDHHLIGFSKSGIGGQDLILKNPTVFAKCMSWDFPSVQMTAYDVPFDGSSSANYGTDANFQANYRLTQAFLNAHATPFQSEPRIWIGDGTAFDSDVVTYDGMLTTAGILHIYTGTVNRSHAWDSGWVSGALAEALKQGVVGTIIVQMHKMSVSVAGKIKISGSGSVRMKKMHVSLSSHIKVPGAGSVRMHKMGIHGSTAHSTVISSSLFVFMDV